MPVTLAVTRVPAPFETVQVCPVGWVCTVTAKLPSSVTGVLKVNAPLARTVSASPPLSFNVSCVPTSRPETVPPIVKLEAPGDPAGGAGAAGAEAVGAELFDPPQPVNASVRQSTEPTRPQTRAGATLCLPRNMKVIRFLGIDAGP